MLFTIKYKDRDFSKIEERVNLNYSGFGLQLSYSICFAFDCGIILEVFGILTPANAQLCLLAYGVIVEPLLFGFVVPDLFDYARKIMKKVPRL